MKKLAILITAWILLAAPLVMAQQMPQQPVPIGVKVLAYNAADIEVKITSHTPGKYNYETIVGKTNENGDYLEDAANFKIGYTDGQEFIIEAADQTKKVIYTNGKFSLYVEFDLIGSKAKCPPELCDPCNCETCETCKTCESCTACTNCETCVTCKVCENCPSCECPEPTEQDAMNLILAALAGAAASGAAVSLTLGSKAKHYHRGIRSKHSIFTRHRDERIRHSVGEIAPVYRKINNKYTYIPKE